MNRPIKPIRFEPIRANQIAEINEAREITFNFCNYALRHMPAKLLSKKGVGQEIVKWLKGHNWTGIPYSEVSGNLAHTQSAYSMLKKQLSYTGRVMAAAEVGMHVERLG